MNGDTEDLDYLTVDSIQWATGYVRPRMSQQDKRAKHRVHQRNFVLRQRERLEELRRELRHLQLQLLWLQAAQEVAALTIDNESLRLQLVTEALPMGPTATLSALTDLLPIDSENLSETPDSIPSEQGSVRVGDSNSFVLEPLALQPEFETEDVMFGASCWLPTCDTENLASVPTSPRSPGGLAVA